ncbi:hypothetical protein Tco_0802966 [Tanacetum coccineum]|uniref:Uncharacterized protein n=1 Tax=Tanacetum coccineum TaxID=301880 RepID=A0ABQ5A0F2_9ASTR
MDFIKTFGYDEDPKAKMTSVSTFVATKLRQPWRAILSVLNKNLRGKDTSWDTIPYTMINDAIKQSVGYMYYKHKKEKCEKGKVVEEPEEQHVSPVKSGRGKGYMRLGNQKEAVLLAQLVSTEEQRLQQQNVMTQLTIERQVEKDVEDTYAAEKGLTLKGVVSEDPAV